MDKVAFQESPFPNCWLSFDLLVMDSAQKFSSQNRERDMHFGMTSGTKPEFDAVLLRSNCMENLKFVTPTLRFLPKK